MMSRSGGQEYDRHIVRHCCHYFCATAVARNMIVISVIIVATIFLVIIRYDIGSAVVVIIVIGRMTVDIMVMVMTIFMGDHLPYCMS